MFPASVDLKRVADLVMETLDIPLEVDYTVTQVPDLDWVVHVQQSWKPVIVNDIVLRFPWHTDDDVAMVLKGSSSNEGAAMVELKLEGGIAFGTGEHPTTQLCLGWIQDILNRHDDIRRLMDYGSGSGVLGLATCAYDEKVEAVGVDIDVDAVRIANSNAKTNNVKMKNYIPSLETVEDVESKSVMMVKTSEDAPSLPPELDGPIYDALVANILAGPLITLAPILARFVRPRGYLGLSGILSPQAENVVKAYSRFFDDVSVEKELNGWVLITGVRKDS
jgi:ribosomal protein L11 methyltransferase